MWTQIIFIVGAMLVFFVVNDWSERQRLKKLNELTSEQLRAMFDDPSSQTLYLKIAVELQSRGVDITFTFPRFLDMCLSNNIAVQLFGWSGLQLFFRDHVGKVCVSSARPSREDVAILSDIRKAMKQKTGL